MDNIYKLKNQISNIKINTNNDNNTINNNKCNNCDEFKKILNNLKQQNDSLKKDIINIKKNIIKNMEPDVLILVGTNKWEETGVFIKRSRYHQGRVCYTSLKTKCAIRWNPELSAWLIDRRGLLYDNEASLIAYEDVIHPGLVTANWLVYNDDMEAWVPSENYRIESVNITEFFFKSEQIFADCNINNNNNNNNNNTNMDHNNNTSNIDNNKKSAKLHKLHEQHYRQPPGLNNINIKKL